MVHIRVVKWFNDTREGAYVGPETGPDVFANFSTVQPAGSESSKGAGAVGYGTVTGQADGLDGVVELLRAKRTSDA